MKAANIQAGMPEHRDRNQWRWLGQQCLLRKGRRTEAGGLAKAPKRGD